MSIAALLLSFLGVHALELPEIIGNNMMLQQHTSARLWGWAKGGSPVEVTVSWNSETYRATADKQTGRWELNIETPAASYEPQSLTIKGDGETRRIENVLIGEVWFCSGQSNMEMPLGGFWNCPVRGANEEIALSGRYRRSIRVATIAKKDALEPQDRVPGGWKVCEPQNAGSFSACGYFFAQTLTEILDVPVGIINCSWGGSCVEGWLPKEILLTYHDGLTPTGDADYLRKMVMFNGMLNPLAGYTVKGFLWNQGESNMGREKEYIDRFKTMVRLWRKMWRQGDDPLPIYTVELPGYSYGDVDGTDCARFRAAQHQIAHELENCGCVSTNDLILPYEAEQIHGCRKKEIGQRLAYMAATRDYGIQGIHAEAPEFVRMKTIEVATKDLNVVAGSAVAANPNDKGQIVCLYFTNLTEGVDRMFDIEGFEAAGADGVWHKATVWAENGWSDPEYGGCFLKLICPEAGRVKNVRYNYHNFTTSQLHNCFGLPVVPFTTAN